ncbi:Adenine-specific methyltransferase [uncultured Candidatus Thioglobus sp.]|nr:Adenine-specific methyltransferase [uncultured Candidatus Thioglobus sp.]
MINKNMIYNNDCIEGMASLENNSVQMILTDPPYLVNYVDRSGRSVANDTLNNSDWLTPAFNEMYRVLNNNSYAVVFYGWSEADKFINAWRSAGFRIIGQFAFAKKYASNGRKDKKHMEYKHECAYLLAKGHPKPFEILPSVMNWTYTGNKLHPTQKPVDLLLRLAKGFCPTGGTVLDPFMGSGSTAMACIKSKMFNYLGYELDSNYFNLAMNRINEQENNNSNNHVHIPRQIVKPRYRYNQQNGNYELQENKLPVGANDTYFENRAQMQGVQNG